MAAFDLKQDIVKSALEELSIWGVTTNPDNEELERGVMVLEQVMASFMLKNIDIGYQFEDTPNPNSLSGVSAAHQHLVATILAVRLAPSYGKLPTDIPGLVNIARGSTSTLMSSAAIVQPVEYPSRMPRGSGASRRWRNWRRYFSPSERPPVDVENVHMSVGDIDDFTEHYDAYLRTAETISAFTITTDSPSLLDILSSAISGGDINYRVQVIGTADDTSTRYATVSMTITTSTGRVTKRVVNFVIT